MVRFLLIMGLLGLSLLAHAQMTQVLRLELPTSPTTDDAYDVLPLAERGLLLTIRQNDLYANAPTTFRFQKYTTDLKTEWTTEYRQHVRYDPVLSYHNDQYLFWLFREPGREDIQVIRVGLDDGLVETFDGTLLSMMDIQHFKVMGNTAFIGGYYHNRPVVMHFSFFDRTTKVLPGLYVNHLEINSLELDEQRGEVHVLVHSLRRRCQFSIRSYAPDGKPLRTVNFEGARNSLISGKLLPVSEQESLLIGNYSADCTPYSQGIYVTRIRHGESGTTVPDRVDPDDIQYIEFSQLQHFFNYLNPKRQEKLRARVGRKKDQGKDFKFRYRLLVHDLMPSEQGLTLLAEVYYPQYRGTNTPFYGGLLRTNDRYFEGYRYTHAFVCGFDTQGNLLWDNCLPIKNLDSPELTEMVQVSRQGELMVLAYPQEGAITTEVIRGSKVVRSSEQYKLKAGSETERVLYSADDNLAAWYGTNFLACGFQKITTNQAAGREREVFYVNKLTYDIEQATRPAVDAAQPDRKPPVSPKTSGSGQ